MKTPLALALALLAVAPVSAQVFRPQTVNGAVLGGIAGAVIGNNSGSLGHNAWKGAAIGAVAGGVIGSLAADEHDRRGGSYRGGGYYGGGGYVYRHTPVVYGGYYRGGYGPYRGGYYGGYYGSVGYYPSYGYYPSDGYYGGGSYATDGLFLGALAGGIIGHNSGSLHHNGWRGAAWGAGIGWLLGSVADANRRLVISERPVYVQPAVQQAAPATPPAAQPQQVTIINNYYGNTAPMSQANSLFGR